MNIEGLLILLIVFVVICVIVWGAIYCIEHSISPIPPPLKMGIALIMLLLFLLYALGYLGGGPILRRP